MGEEYTSLDISAALLKMIIEKENEGFDRTVDFETPVEDIRTLKDLLMTGSKNLPGLKKKAKAQAIYAEKKMNHTKEKKNPKVNINPPIPREMILLEMINQEKKGPIIEEMNPRVNINLSDPEETILSEMINQEKKDLIKEMNPKVNINLPDPKKMILLEGINLLTKDPIKEKTKGNHQNINHLDLQIAKKDHLTPTMIKPTARIITTDLEKK